MRGAQLARQWRVRRAIEASPNGLMVAEIARPQGGTVDCTEGKPFKSLFQ